MSNANRIYERSTRASLYNENKIEFVHEPMFLGAGRNTQRFESLKYDYFDKSNDEQQGFDWKHDEISLIKDIKDFKGPLPFNESKKINF
jgi:ribonucleotide reductase beta subunit family protein with ferritin-like domain